MRYEVSLAQTLDVSDHPEKIEPLAAGPHVRNTGLVKNGGIASLEYAREDVPVGHEDDYMIADREGTKWSLRYYLTGYALYKNGVFHKALGAFRVAYRNLAPGGFDDYVLADGGAAGPRVLGCRIEGAATVVVEEYSIDGRLLNRATYPMAAVTLDSVSFIRRLNITFATATEFIGQWFSTARVYHLNGGTGVATLLAGIATTPEYQLYAYKYASAGNYIVFDPGRRFCFVSNISAGVVGASITCWHLAVEDNFLWDRHIITKKPVLNGASIEAAALIGHTALGAAFSAVPVWQTPGGLNASAVLDDFAIGPNYVETLYTDNVSGRPAWFSYGLNNMAPAQYLEQTNLVNGYALLPSTPFRINVLRGLPDFLSISKSGPGAGQGVILSEVGGIDYSYVMSRHQAAWAPDDTADTCLYKTEAGMALCIVVGGDTAYNTRLGVEEIPPLQDMGDGLVKIATSSPWSVIDSNSGEVYFSGSDYHGAIQPVYTAPSPGGIDQMVGKIVSPVGNTVDPGEISVADGWSWVNCYGVGQDMPVDVYVDGVYYASYDRAPTVGTPSFFPELEGALYIADTGLPIPSGANHQGPGAYIPEASFVRTREKDTYLIGNTLMGLWEFFSLYSATYALASGKIYGIIQDSAGLIEAPTVVAEALGVRLFAVGPGAAYLYAFWDNSIMAFDGGQSLQKVAIFSQAATLSKGAFSTVENTLYLDADGKIYTIRDSFISEIDKTARQVARTILCPTVDGLAVIDGGGATFYYLEFAPKALSVPPIPLELQTAYLGQQANQRGILSAIVFTVYSPTKNALDVTIGVDQFDETDDYTQRETIHVTAQDYSAQGYFRMRLQPQVQRALGSSIYFACPQKVLLASIAITYEDETQSVIPEGASV